MKTRIIVLTDREYQKFLLNIDQIESISPTLYGAEIISKSGVHYISQETVREIAKLIDERSEL